MSGLCKSKIQLFAWPRKNQGSRQAAPRCNNHKFAAERSGHRHKACLQLFLNRRVLVLCAFWFCVEDAHLLSHAVPTCMGSSAPRACVEYSTTYTTPRVLEPNAFWLNTRGCVTTPCHKEGRLASYASCAGGGSSKNTWHGFANTHFAYNGPLCALEASTTAELSHATTTARKGISLVEPNLALTHNISSISGQKNGPFGSEVVNREVLHLAR